MEKMFDYFITFCSIYFMYVGFKAIVIGSDYNFYYRIKYGKVYQNWYENRATFENYLEINK